MKIAVLLTCYNRKLKTLACLAGLYDSTKVYNTRAEEKIEIEVYLTDDGCTDGTAVALKEKFPNEIIHILQGTGNMFWARGMCFAWEEARKRHSEWDYYLLMNDDTIMLENGMDELFKALHYSVANYQAEGIISGITCSTTNPNEITYGGDVIPNKINGRQIRLGKSDHPQMVDMTNANILLVPSAVVDKIGIFYSGFNHSSADNDYTLMARRHNIPVLITAEACGQCDNDHGSSSLRQDKILSMSLSERKAYYSHPLHSTHDYLTFIRRNMPLRYPLSWLFRMMLVYCPQLYFAINKQRKITK